MNAKRKCFVIMPFSKTTSCTKKEWTGIFKGIIKPAIEQSGLNYECERSIAQRENIIKGILESLNTANIVIADLTDSNPNVFYELGVRHTLTNRTVLIAQDKKHIPFDLEAYPTTFYSKNLTDIDEFKEAIKKTLEDIEKNPERPDNPVADFLKKKNVLLLNTEKSANTKKLSALISELSRNIDYSKNFLNTARGNQEARKGKDPDISIPTGRFETSCLELLVSANYIIIPKASMTLATSLHSILNNCNNRLDTWQNSLYAVSIEKSFMEDLPNLDNVLVALFKNISEIRLNYINDNYIEPTIPPYILSNPEHAEYIKGT